MFRYGLKLFSTNANYVAEAVQKLTLPFGLLSTVGHNICYSHSNKDIEYTLRVYETVLEIIKEAINKNNVKTMLKGKPVQLVFRKA